MVNTFVSALATDIQREATPEARAFGKMTPRAEVLRKCREEESTDVPNESRTEMENTAEHDNNEVDEAEDSTCSEQDNGSDAKSTASMTLEVTAPAAPQDTLMASLPANPSESNDTEESSTKMANEEEENTKEGEPSTTAKGTRKTRARTSRRASKIPPCAKLKTSNESRKLRTRGARGPNRDVSAR